MSIRERLNDDLKQAMRSGDLAARDVIRFLRSDIHNQEIARQTELDEEAIFEVLSRQAQQRRDSIEAFEKGGRQDLVDKEQGELAIILEYLPEQMTADEIEAVVRETIAELGAAGPQDMGKVMGKVMPQVKGRAQGRQVSGAVTQLLKDLGTDPA